jgi:hypothetical protein
VRWLSPICRPASPPQAPDWQSTVSSEKRWWPAVSSWPEEDPRYAIPRLALVMALTAAPIVVQAQPFDLYRTRRVEIMIR